MLLLSAGFIAKFELVFVLTLENAFSQTFHFKANKKSTILLENDARDFQSSPPFKRSACFYETTSGSFERFQYFNFETSFLENEKLFSKNGSIFFQLKILRLKTHSFPYKAALSEANVKTNRMMSTKWTYHKEWIFASNYFIFFFENFVSV